jgi:hypothetical protein
LEYFLGDSIPIYDNPRTQSGEHHDIGTDPAIVDTNPEPEDSERKTFKIEVQSGA